MKQFETKPLIELQRYGRNLVFGYFAVLTVLLFIGVEDSLSWAKWGFIGVLVLTFAKVILFAILFSKAKLSRHVALSYLLGLILLSTIALKLWIL